VALFLVRYDEDRAMADELRLALDRFELRPGLILVDSELALSPLYHRIKWALPAGSALLVAPLAAAPKFKGMDQGVRTWLRDRTRPSESMDQQPGSA
jgi:hypothetical protein